MYHKKKKHLGLSISYNSQRKGRNIFTKKCIEYEFIILYVFLIHVLKRVLKLYAL